MTASDLLICTRLMGVELSVDGEEIHFRARPGTLTPKLRSSLLAHKAEILAELAGQTPRMLELDSWPPRPLVLAGWPVWLRARWGLRSAEFEDAGVPWPESERQAFDEVRASVAAANDEGDR